MFLDCNSQKSWPTQQVVKASGNCSPRTSGDLSLRNTVLEDLEQSVSSFAGYNGKYRSLGLPMTNSYDCILFFYHYSHTESTELITAEQTTPKKVYRISEKMHTEVGDQKPDRISKKSIFSTLKYYSRYNKALMNILYLKNLGNSRHQTELT